MPHTSQATGPRTLRERIRASPPLTGANAYALAIASEAIAILFTRLTWPMMLRAPFALLFFAVYVTARWGSRAAGVLATVLAAVGSTVASPTFGQPPFGYGSIAVFVTVALIGAHLISERNEAITALRSSEAQFRATWEHAALGAALLDRLGRVERINPALERFLGHSASTWVGGFFSQFSHPADATVEDERLGELMAGRDSRDQFEQRYRHQDGSVRWGRVTLSAVRGAGSAPTGALMAVEDVTARRQAEADLKDSEEKLRRAQKMEAVGQLVAGVAHNFNNLLTITGGYAELLVRQGGADSDLDRHALDEIQRAAERGAALTRQLLAFSRKRETRAVPVDVNTVVTGLRELLSRAIREDTRLTIEPAPEHATVLVDPDDFEQVILNLVINARDALPMGGTIVIEITRQWLDASDGQSDAPVTPGEYVRVRVRDDGVGMSPEVQAHLFEPFFTTKEVGQGTGLGLAFVYGTVRQHQGLISVESTPDVGTTFTLYFPLQPEAATTAASSVSLLGIEGRPATILLVEDEDAVRAVTARTLRRAGHRVLEAALPSAACALFDRHANEIDLLLTDVVMPEMHGPALAARLTAQRPGLRVLLVSGYSDSASTVETGAARPIALSKPFAPSQLLDAVAGAIGVSRVAANGG